MSMCAFQIMIDFDTLFEGREFARTRYEQLIPKLKVILELDDADVSRKYPT